MKKYLESQSNFKKYKIVDIDDNTKYKIYNIILQDKLTGEFKSTTWIAKTENLNKIK